MLGNSQRGLSPRNRTLAYKAVTLPVLTYGLVLWYAEDRRGVKKHLMVMRRVHSFALRWITGAFRGTPNSALEMIAHIPPLDVLCNLSIYGLMACIHTLPDNHLLKIAWQGDLVKLAYRQIRPK